MLHEPRLLRGGTAMHSVSYCNNKLRSSPIACCKNACCGCGKTRSRRTRLPGSRLLGQESSSSSRPAGISGMPNIARNNKSCSLWNGNEKSAERSLPVSICVLSRCGILHRAIEHHVNCSLAGNHKEDQQSSTAKGTICENVQRG